MFLDSLRALVFVIEFSASCIAQYSEKINFKRLSLFFFFYLMSNVLEQLISELLNGIINARNKRNAIISSA